MFLSTTAIEDFWDKSQKILFLGEWCRLYSRKSEWENLDNEVLPYHWDDRKKLYQDYLYVNDLYEKVLVQLSTYLNDIHGVSYSNRYWRIILGPWLHWFIGALYDRFESIRIAELSAKVTDTYITKFSFGIRTPNDFVQFISMSLNDEYNYFLFSKIIEFTGRLPYRIVDARNIDKKQNSTHQTNLNREKKLSRVFIKNALQLWDRLIPSRFNKVVFVASYFYFFNQIKLQLKLGQFPYSGLQVTSLPEFDFDPAIRRKIFLRCETDAFEKLLSHLLPEQIPKCYLEGYRSTTVRALVTYPKKPKVIFTANAYWSNELFKFWAAHWSHQGSKYALAQHGGTVGSALWSFIEEHECKTADVFYTWGWVNKQNKNIKPMPAVKLIDVEKIKFCKRGKVLLATLAVPRYSYHMYSIPVASSGNISFMNNQLEFIHYLLSDVRKILNIRLYSEDYGYCQKNRFKNHFPDIQCYQGSKSFYQQLLESRLFIGTYNSTTYLETFAANFPTVLFWNPQHWELRPSAKPYFDKLRRVGILHDTPESAAAKVNEIYKDPYAWWNQAEIQEAKDEFCRQFARTSENWLKEWKIELHNLANR